MKNKYDSSVVFLYSIGREHLLPLEFRQKIPYSAEKEVPEPLALSYLNIPFLLFMNVNLRSTEV